MRPPVALLGLEDIHSVFYANAPAGAQKAANGALPSHAPIIRKVSLRAS